MTGVNEVPFSIQPDEIDIENLSRYSSANLSPEEMIEYEVKFDGIDDEENINRRLSYWRKWLICILLGVTSLCITMLSSVWSMASNHIMEYFHISREVDTLGISLYIFGIGAGPLFLSPISEFYGRKITYIIALSFCCIFEVLTAFSPNYGALIFGRFMSGFFGSAFLSVSGGSLTDIFEKSEIGTPMCIFSLAPLCGPSLGPLVSVFINEHMYWRWTFYIILIYSGVMLVLIILLVPETYVPVLLIKKAQRLRNVSGDNNYYAPLENLRKEASVLKTCLAASKRPFLLLLRDRMMAILCFYSGLALAIVYLFFVAFPYIFNTVFGFKAVGQGLSFIGILIGMILGGSTSSYFQKVYNNTVLSKGKPKPEMRLIPLMIGAFILPIGLFIFAWTSFSHVHWIGALIGTLIFGVGVSLVFQGIIGYTTDAYRLYSASAMACNSFIRSYMAGVFPLFALQLYEGIGVNWGSSLLGFLTILMIPFPFLFYRFGEELRSKSPYTWSEN